MYQVTYVTSGSFGMNFQIESATESGSDTHLVLFCFTYIVACGQEENGASHLFQHSRKLRGAGAG